MKRLFCSLLLILCVKAISHSQTVSDKPISEIDVEYIEVIPDVYSSFKTKHILLIDYGQGFNRTFRKDCVLKNEKGEAMLFNSPMHAVNYICQFGYEVINVIKRESDLDGDRYLLKRVKKQ